MALTEIEKEWEETRKKLQDDPYAEKEREDFEADIEISKKIYRTMKKIGLWPKDGNDTRNFDLVTRVFGQLEEEEIYELVEFRDWLKKTLDAAFQGKEIDEDSWESRVFGCCTWKM
jgi:hypothetical protein